MLQFLSAEKCISTDLESEVSGIVLQRSEVRSAGSEMPVSSACGAVHPIFNALVAH